MFIRKPDLLCSHLRLTPIVLHMGCIIKFDCWRAQDNAISLANIPKRHCVVTTKLQFTRHR